MAERTGERREVARIWTERGNLFLDTRGTVIELTPVQAIEFANQIIRRVGRMAGGSMSTREGPS